MMKQRTRPFREDAVVSKAGARQVPPWQQASVVSSQERAPVRHTLTHDVIICATRDSLNSLKLMRFVDRSALHSHAAVRCLRP